MELGVHRGVAIALAIAQLHFAGNLRDAIGPPARSTTADLDLLAGDFDAAVNAVLRVVSVEEIICELP
jgi:hypothetical protein